MKLLVFGSLNIDHVYQLNHLVREGETIDSGAYQKNEGGKGFNQAVALLRARQEIAFAGAIGKDGAFLRNYLADLGADVRHVHTVPAPTGHAIIQVDAGGRNAIILYGGANRMITQEMITQTLADFEPGDYILLQNEINCLSDLIVAAAARGMRVVLNPSPITEELLAAPLHRVDTFLLNEVEGRDITGEDEPERILDALIARYPDCRVVLTLGERGAIYAHGAERVCQPAIPAHAEDTTAAGDTFTGFFLHAMLSGKPVSRALREAAQASSIAVSRKGAAKSIPTLEEVTALIE